MLGTSEHFLVAGYRLFFMRAGASAVVLSLRCTLLPLSGGFQMRAGPDDAEDFAMTHGLQIGTEHGTKPAPYCTRRKTLPRGGPVSNSKRRGKRSCSQLRFQ